VLIANLFGGIQINIISFASLSVLLIVPGFFLIGLTKLNTKMTLLEQFLLSYMIGILFYGFLWLSCIYLNIQNGSIILLTLTLVLSICNVIIYRDSKKILNSSKIELYGIGIVLLFYVFAWLILYPDHLRIISDISLRYSEALTLANSPEKLRRFFYLLQTAFDSFFYSISMSSIQQNLLTQLMLLVFFPLSVMAAAKRIFPGEPYKVVISVFFFTVLNAVWGSLLNLVNLLIAVEVNSSLTIIQAINYLNTYTQYSFIYSVMALWMIPNFVNLIAIFALIAFVFNKEISKSQLFVIVSILSSILYLTHIAEGVIIAALISSYYLIQKDKGRKNGGRPQAILLAFLLSNGIALAIFYSTYLFGLFPSLFLSNNLYIALWVSFLGLSASLIIGEFLKNIHIVSKEYVHLISIMIAILTLALFFISLSGRIVEFMNLNYDLEQIGWDSGRVEWYNYSLLGTKLVLALIAIIIISKNRESQKVNLFVYGLIFAIAFGNFLTFFNTTIYSSSYTEKRLSQFIGISIPFLIPFFFGEMKRQIEKIKSYHTQLFVKLGLIFIIVNSTFLFIPIVIDTRHRYANSVYSLKVGEWEGLEHLEDLVRSNPQVGIYCLTERGEDYLPYTGSPDSLAYSLVSDGSKTYSDFKHNANLTFGSKDVYVFIINYSDERYLLSFKDDLLTFLSESPVYFKNDDSQIIGPLTFY
jgi:hypothetical protein